MMKKQIWIISVVVLYSFLFAAQAKAQKTPAISEATQACLSCHGFFHLGIKSDWERSHHGRVTPAEALEKDKLQRRVSSEKIPEPLLKTVVGCAECHTLNSEKHADTYDHNGYKVHLIVTPSDCSTCHPVEADQYGKNIMAYAYGNLNNNALYKDLMNSVNGVQTFEKMATTLRPPDAETNNDSCFYCHGTEIKVLGQRTRETPFGTMNFPILSGWPNQGTGRINPDGSRGACTACHTRHQFSIEMARKPYTCSECHKGPDVPGYAVYEVSKHGNIHSSLGKGWNFEAVPWTVGKDLTAPTCATCHVSLLFNEESGDVIAQRTHQMSDRLAWRMMGLIYAHAQPISPDTTLIKNKAGLPLPTELTGEPVSEYLIDSGEQERRNNAMQKICRSCHTEEWVKGQFARIENTMKTTNEMTLAATKILLAAWEKGLAKGPAQKDSPFNEAIEKKWVEQWLFYGNSTRFASAMVGADYGVFANGRWYLSKNIQEMLDWLEFKLQKTPEKAEGQKK